MGVLDSLYDETMALEKFSGKKFHVTLDESEGEEKMKKLKITYDKDVKP